MRIGPRMKHLKNLVSAHPGRVALWYVERIGPHGSRRYGYETVHRAIRARIVHSITGAGRIHLYPRKDA